MYYNTIQYVIGNVHYCVQYYNKYKDAIVDYNKLCTNITYKPI